ncbi:MAG: HAD family hydrolase [Paracoccaceae bacterium]
MRRVTAIGFDADDTLWHNERFFRLGEARFTDLLRGYADADRLSERLLEAEKRNVQHYGYGAKGFTLSMIETAIEITEGRVPASVIGDILDAGRDILRHPVEPLPHVEDTLGRLAGRYRMVLITKGDLFHQERKLAASGMGDLFDAVEIVSEKTPDIYRLAFAHHGDGPERAMMVGNSLKSDVIPAIEAGSWGVHVPHDVTWALEHDEPPEHSPRFRRLDHLGSLEALLEDIG